MDLTFSGPDNTSQTRPFTFWCNNNYDRWATTSGVIPVGSMAYTDLEQDDQLDGTCPATPKVSTPDCNYLVPLGGSSWRAIPCTRDLEDFARLWICGITPNVLTNLPDGSTITLNWGDAGNPSYGNPTIDLFAAADPDGGIGYLTNETIAVQQTNISIGVYLGRLGPGQSIQLNGGWFPNMWAGNRFIWCGVSNGMGGLNLTIADTNGNPIAQTTSYVQILDIKQMYERYTVGDIPSVAPTNTALPAENGPPGSLPFQYGTSPGPGTPYILFVHGFNLPLWLKDRFAETEFKRLYWQGYEGRFGSFRWPTTLQTKSDTMAFDDSEWQAWTSAPGLLGLLTSLNHQYPGQVYLTAHSHGNVVAGEALRLAGSNGVVNTYIAMQAAVDAHTYDQTTPARPITWPFAYRTPDRYGQYYTNGASCYFDGVRGAGTYVNFFNTNDWALNTTWPTDQSSKPDMDYYYVPGSDTWYYHIYNSPTNTPLAFPQQTYMLYSYADQAHAFALGAQANVGGAFGGNQVELDVAPYRFLSQHLYHSAEFRSDNASRWQFWDAVLGKLGIPTQ